MDETKLEYCKFCNSKLEIDNVTNVTLICRKCNVKFYHNNIFRIIYNIGDCCFWFTFFNETKRTVLYKDNKFDGSYKVGEWNEILNISPSNIEKKLKTILVFL